MYLSTCKSKISGPLLDRIDIHIEVPAVKFDELSSSEGGGEGSEDIRKRVMKARDIQNLRYESFKNTYSNSSISNKGMEQFCKLDEESTAVFKQAIETLSLSARAYNRILKVARTIADLDGNVKITIDHISEAIQYRSLDKKYI